MTFKSMATVAAVIAASAGGGGCSAISPYLPSYLNGAVGSASGRPASAAAPPAAAAPTGQVYGTDPDPNVRFEILRQGRQGN
jgi:hypothetical protein